MLTLDEINKLVKEKFPYQERELTCWSFADRMQKKRDKYKAELLNNNIQIVTGVPVIIGVPGPEITSFRLINPDDSQTA